MISANDRTIEVDVLLWQGVTIEVSYEADWLSLKRLPDRTVHLSITAIMPKRAPLPFTETGYRSHFVHRDDVAEAGGPAAYVSAWLDDAARSPEWLEHERTSRQLSLF